MNVMFTEAYLEELGNGMLRHEEQLLRAECERRGIPVVLYLGKQMARRQLPLSAATFVAGDMDAMHGAMQQLNIAVPAPNDYPPSLAPFLHRRVWQSTLDVVEREIVEGRGEPVFVKPASRRKSFTGRAFASIDDFREIGGVSRRQEVWCSEVVSWVSEYRVYVIGTKIVAVDFYAGDPEVSVDLAAVTGAVAAYYASGEAPAAYGIDFGVLSSGQTALVEVNDGYSLGAYAISGRAYTDLVLARWQELVSAIPSAEGKFTQVPAELYPCIPHTIGNVSRHMSYFEKMGGLRFEVVPDADMPGDAIVAVLRFSSGEIAMLGTRHETMSHGVELLCAGLHAEKPVLDAFREAFPGITAAEMNLCRDHR